MKLKELECRAGELLAEVDRLAEHLELAVETFEAHCRCVINEMLRKPLIEEIDGIGGALLEKAAKKERELNMFPLLYKGDEVWIQAIYLEEDGTKYFGFNVVTMKRETARQIAMEMEEEGERVSASSRGFSKVRYTPVEEFEERMEKLKHLILSGRLDDILRMKAEEVMWEIMGYGGKLLPALGSESKIKA